MKKFIDFKNKKTKQIIILVLILVFIISIPTLSKFISKKFHEFYLNSKHFYFYSNRLKDDNPLYQLNNWSGVGNFDIEFDLTSEKNRYTYAEYDISYTVSANCPSTVTCSLSETGGTIYSTNTNHSNSIVLHVVPNRVFVEGETLSISVTASSTSPYNKTIQARYEYVVGKSGVTYEIEDETGREYIVLKMTNAVSYCTVISAFENHSIGDRIDDSEFITLSPENKNKCISQYINISFNPQLLLVDNTSSIFDYATYTTTSIGGVQYINNMTFKIDPLSTLALRFYKENVGSNYTYPFENNSSIVTVNVSDPS